MFINRPSDRVQGVARDHLTGTVNSVIPVSWGFGLSTPGIFAFVFAFIMLGTLIGSQVSNWLLAPIMCGPMVAILIQTRRGKLGQGLLAMTAPTGDDAEVVALKSKWFAAFTPSGEVRKTYPTGTAVQLLGDRRWWQGMRCRVDDDTYYLNPNYDDEATTVLTTVAT